MQDEKFLTAFWPSLCAGFPAPQKETFFGSGRSWWKPEGLGRNHDAFPNKLPSSPTAHPTAPFPLWLVVNCPLPPGGGQLRDGAAAQEPASSAMDFCDGNLVLPLIALVTKIWRSHLASSDLLHLHLSPEGMECRRPPSKYVCMGLLLPFPYPNKAKKKK